jgi:hypothetical protein
MTEVIHVRFPGNWEALYVDGERVAQNHSVDVADVLNHIEDETITEARSEYNAVQLHKEFGAVAPENYNELP